MGTGLLDDLVFAPGPLAGRRHASSTAVHLADAGPDGALRPDGLARHLQDVATDDWASSGISETATWVVRRSSFRLVGGRWPRLGDQIELTTFCSGTGAAWAERRTNLALDGDVAIESTAIWVPVDQGGRPQRLQPSFFEVYGESTAGRRVSGRVPGAGDVPEEAERRDWPLRRSDLDVVGHVNNAALWSAMSEVAQGPLAAGTMIHHGAVLGDDYVSLAWVTGRLWLTVGGVVAVSGAWDSGPAPLELS
jgi:acyl-ACP thioesterase